MDITLSATTNQTIATTGDLLAAWADFLRLDVAAGDASPQTVATYQAQVQHFLAWCEDVHPALATEDDLKAYRAHLAEQYARATVATRLAAIRRFYQAAVWRGYRADNPAEGLKAPPERTAREERVRFLSLEGLKQLLDAPDPSRRGQAVRATRDRAIRRWASSGPAYPATACATVRRCGRGRSAQQWTRWPICWGIPAWTRRGCTQR